jgi:hypothetical protein
VTGSCRTGRAGSAGQRQPHPVPHCSPCCLNPSPTRRCDNITIAPPLLKELEASTDPLPYKLWPRMVRR